MKSRCAWARGELNEQYHDREWGVPVHDDRTLFEFLTLEGAQAGLSWTTILQKRDNYGRAFARFDACAVARFTEDDAARLMSDSGIVRNRLKIASTITNARAFLEVQAEFGTFDQFIWGFTNGKSLHSEARSLDAIPASTDVSDRMSKELKRRGFRFVGTTICYAFMQAVGIVNDHTTNCFRYDEIRELGCREQ